MAPQPILTVKPGLICSELTLNRHCISGKNDADQKRRSRLSLAAIALAEPDGYRFTFDTALRRRGNDPSPRC